MQREWLTKSLEQQAATMDVRLKRLSASLGQKVARLNQQLSQLDAQNVQQQDWLKSKIAVAYSQRGAVEELEARVVTTLGAAKASLESFTGEMSALEDSTKRDVDELQRKIEQNEVCCEGGREGGNGKERRQSGR